MTEEYKENLLKYFTGNMPSETGEDVPQFIVNEDIENDFGNFLVENIPDIKTTVYSDMTYVYFETRGFLQADNSSKILIYGNYSKTSGNDMYGAIIILDDDFKPIKAFTKFDSGTDFRRFIMLNIDEDNYIYGVDSRTDYLNGETYRFIMLNKVIGSGEASGNYQVILRQSYYFPVAYNTMLFGYFFDKTNRLLKKPGGANYLFIGGVSGSPTTRILKLTVNVGEANNWVVYNYNADLATAYIGTYLSWTEDEPVLRIGGFNSSTQAYQEIKLENETITLKNTIANVGWLTSVIFRNESDTYIASYNEATVGIYKINYLTDTLLPIYTHPSQALELGDQISMYLKNGLVCVQIAFEVGMRLFDMTVGIIYKDTFYGENIGEFRQYGGSFDIPVIYVKNDYNLWKIIKMVNNSYTEVEFIFNYNNYNGEEFIDKNSLEPNSSILYDSDGNIIFARNLYNKTLQESTTQASVNVPNNYLNNINIVNKELISTNNNKLVIDENVITKNVYETLLINFFNTIKITNNNDINNPIQNPTGASRLNNSVSESIDYENAKMTKVRINYADNSTFVQGCYWESIGNYYRLSYAVNVVKEINSIDLLSEDETTIYQTIDNLELTVGNTYTIKQDVYIDNKID